MFIMLGYDGEQMSDLRATVDHLKRTAPDVFLTTVSYPIKGTPYYDTVADRLSSPKAWHEGTDRDLVVRGRPVRRYYDFARRWMTAEVARDQHWRRGRYARAARVGVISAGRTPRHGRHANIGGSGDRSLQPVELAVSEEAAADVVAGARLDARGRVRLLHRRRQCRGGPDREDSRHRSADAASRAIAVTVMPGPQLRAAVTGCRQLKRVLPGVPIIWGGYFPSQHADACLSEATVDMCVRGQGEQTIVEVIRALRRGGALSSIAGLAYRAERRGASHAAARVDAARRTAGWPYHRLPMERYFHTHYLGERVATHHSSFGCPFACNFCAVVGMCEPQMGRAVAGSRRRGARDVQHATTAPMRCSSTTWTSSSPRRARWRLPIASRRSAWRGGRSAASTS